MVATMATVALTAIVPRTSLMRCLTNTPVLSPQRFAFFGRRPCQLFFSSSSSDPSAVSSDFDANGANHFLPSQHDLQNEYFAVRHGQSNANVAQIISSDPLVSTVTHGLTQEGKAQASQAGRDMAELYFKIKKQENEQGRDCQGVALISSDFLRAKETALGMADQLNEEGVPLFRADEKDMQDVNYDKRLRERSFGTLHDTSTDNYERVWAFDATDGNHREWNVESVYQVVDRTTSMILDWENRFRQECEKNEQYWLVACVSHGDTLQILQTAFLKEDGKLHRTVVEHLENAKLRRMG